MTTPDIAGLCERLRDFSETWSMYEKHRELTTEAADTLERQAAEIERLRTGLEKVAAYYGPGHRVTEIARAALTGEDT
jgi:cell division protein FtsL